jgi:lipopolysaccharide transport system ATP-binding protein
MSDIAVHTVNLGKQYHIGRVIEKHRTLRDAIVEAATSPFRRLGGVLRGQAAQASSEDDTIWALRNVSFEVKRGEVVGVIGRNGAGKSTFLKILSRITEPTEGWADIHGRVGSLLEVGTGFHTELTGRENVYLNGAILGMRRQEIDNRFDEIVAFSEVSKFIDTPVKHYSSGMRLRLGFAVAAHLNPEILLVDEVLAVGDAAFQKKCIGRMNSVATEGRTVLFVSHNMGAITQLCERTLWLDNGQVRREGPTTEVVAAYMSEGRDSFASWSAPEDAPADLEVLLQSARLLSSENELIDTVAYSEACKVKVGFQVKTPIRDLSIGLRVHDAMGHIVFETMDTDYTGLKGAVREPGTYASVCTLPRYFLKPGRYYVGLMTFIERIKTIERYESVLCFDVTEVGYRLNFYRFGVVTPVLDWETMRIDVPTHDGLEPVVASNVGSSAFR